MVSKKVIIVFIVALITVSLVSTLYILDSVTILKKAPKLATSNKGTVSLTIQEPPKEDIVKTSESSGKLSLNIEEPK